ncbi:MAG TPA: glutaredoxin domain-containing protein [Myxococcales bacterium]|jgi:glutaredoxin-like YruB-family protein
MSLVRIHDSQSLLAAVNTGHDEAIVGFFAGSSEVALQAQPEFERFCAEHEDLASYLVDLEKNRDLASGLGVDVVPAVLKLDGTRVLQKIVGPQTSAFYAQALAGGASRQTAEKAARPAHRVLVYATSSCPWCVKVKTYLKQHGVAFEEINVSRDPGAAQRMVARSGQQGVPQLDIDGHVVVGFDKRRIDALLGLHGASTTP